MKRILFSLFAIGLTLISNAQWIASGIPETVIDPLVYNNDCRSDYFLGNIGTLHVVTYSDGNSPFSSYLNWNRNTSTIAQGRVTLPSGAGIADVTIRSVNIIHVVYELGSSINLVDYVWNGSTYVAGTPIVINNASQPALDNFNDDFFYTLAYKSLVGTLPIVLEIRKGNSNALITSTTIAGAFNSNPDVSVQGTLTLLLSDACFATVAFNNTNTNKIDFAQYQVLSSRSLALSRSGSDLVPFFGARSRPKIASDLIFGKGFAITFDLNNRIYADGFDHNSSLRYNHDLTSSFPSSTPFTNLSPVVAFLPNRIFFAWSSGYDYACINGCPYNPLAPRTGILAYSLDIHGDVIPTEVYHQVENTVSFAKYPTIASDRILPDVAIAFRDMTRTLSKVIDITSPSYKTSNSNFNTKLNSSTLSIWPNPTTNSFTIQGDANRPYSIVITDINGKSIFTSHGTLNTLNQELSFLHNLSNGMYLVNLQDLISQERKTEKLIKN